MSCDQVWRVVSVKRSGMPGPWPWPVVGNAFSIIPHALHLSQFDFATRYGSVMCYWLGPEPWVLLSSVENIRVAFQDKFTAFDRESTITRLWHDIAGGLALQPNGDGHKRSRDLVRPAFRASNINNLIAHVVERARHLLDTLESHAKSGEPLDIQHEFQKLTFDIIGDLSMKFDFKTQTDETSPYIHAFNYCMQHLIWRFIIPFPYWRFYKTNGVLEYEKHIDFLRSTIRGVIEKRRAQGVRDDDHDILAFMLRECGKEGKEWVDGHEIMMQTITFLLAGHDTTAVTLTWLFYFLARTPAAQQRVRDEVDAVLGSETPTYHHLRALAHIDKAITETLRMRPATPSLGREVTEDVTVDDGRGRQFTLAKGTKVGLSLYSAGMSPANGWSDPEVFDPERKEWTDGSKNAFFSFGLGPRACIGEDLARKEIKTVTSMILQKYELRLVASHPVEMEMATTLKARYGVQMTVHLRK